MWFHLVPTVVCWMDYCWMYLYACCRVWMYVKKNICCCEWNGVRLCSTLSSASAKSIKSVFAVSISVIVVYCEPHVVQSICRVVWNWKRNQCEPVLSEYSTVTHIHTIRSITKLQIFESNHTTGNIYIYIYSAIKVNPINRVRRLCQVVQRSHFLPPHRIGVLLRDAQNQSPSWLPPLWTPTIIRTRTSRHRIRLVRTTTTAIRRPSVVAALELATVDTISRITSNITTGTITDRHRWTRSRATSKDSTTAITTCPVNTVSAVQVSECYV